MISSGMRIFSVLDASSRVASRSSFKPIGILLLDGSDQIKVALVVWQAGAVNQNDPFTVLPDFVRAKDRNEWSKPGAGG